MAAMVETEQRVTTHETPGARQGAAVRSSTAQVTTGRDGLIAAARRRPADALDAVLARVVAERGNRAAAAHANLLQRATRVSDVQLRPNPSAVGLLSASGRYLVNAAGQLWVEDGTPAPRRCAAAGDHEYRGLGEHRRYFTQYVPSHDFIADCLHSAEEIINDREISYEGGTINSRTRTADAAYTPFGEGDEENIAAATAAHAFGDGARTNANARAAPGQAYVIVETGMVDEGRWPYHAAGVIAVDGLDTVTMEMFASEETATDEDRGDQAPVFAMYGNGGATTFHAKWSGVFANPITIVIEPGAA